MALTVETGAIVAGADSYITLTDARTYLTSRGMALSADDTVAEQQLRTAFDYIESFRSKFKGIKVTSAQMTAWPRSGAYIDTYEIPSDTIPTQLKYAQAQAASAINSGLNPLSSGTGAAFILKEKVGPIETQYSEAISTSGLPILRGVNNLLEVLLSSTAFITVERA